MELARAGGHIGAVQVVESVMLSRSAKLRQDPHGSDQNQDGLSEYGEEAEDSSNNDSSAATPLLATPPTALKRKRRWVAFFLVLPVFARAKILTKEIALQIKL